LVYLSDKNDLDWYWSQRKLGVMEIDKCELNIMKTEKFIHRVLRNRTYLLD